MHKDELIMLHAMLAEMKTYYEAKNPEASFSKYYALNITPSQTHKSKTEHKYAIFVLGEELANCTKASEDMHINRIAARMSALAKKIQEEIE